MIAFQNCHIIVDTTINFNDKPTLMAIEICNKSIDRMLSSKLISPQ